MLALSIVAASSSAHVVAPDSVSATRAAKKKETRPGWQIAGAVKLAKGDVKKVSNRKRTASALCGKVVSKRFKNGRWIPGSQILSGKTSGWFLSLTQESLNLKKKALRLRGGDRKKLLTLANSKRLRASREINLCNTLNTSGSGSGVPLRFSIADAVGVVQGSATSRRGSYPSTRQTSTGIQAVLADGSLRNAISSGTATVTQIAVSPSGQLVVAFQNKVNLDNASASYSGTGCVIVTVERSTGVPTCIDTTLSGLYGISNGVESIQFDAEGGVYYSGYVCGQSCTTVFRRYKNGALTELINSQISIHEFLVAGNGTIFMFGQTTATNTSFNRRINASGGLQNLGTPASPYAGYYRLFADGNVYMYGDNGTGLARFMMTTDSIDSAVWIGISSGSPAPTHAWDTYCAGAGATTGPCIANPSHANYAQNRLQVQTASGKNFLPATDGLMQAYPTLAASTLPIRTISLLEASGNIVLAAGTTTTGENQLVKFDSDTNTATTIASRASANGEIEFYHVEPSSNGYALFDGLRFSDNTYVIGRINYSTGDVTILSTVTGKLDDFKVF